MTDHQLLDALRHGSNDAFDRIFRDHYPGLVRFAESMLHDRSTGEEVAQEVMLELWRRRETLAVETSLRAYLFRSARNRSLNLIRHEQIVQREETAVAASVPPADAADRNALDAEIDAAVRAAVAQLPPRCREVFQLSRFDGLTYAEIGAALDISIKTVEAQMGKALRVLRERLAAWTRSDDPDDATNGGATP